MTHYRRSSHKASRPTMRQLALVTGCAILVAPIVVAYVGAMFPSMVGF